MMVCYFRFKKAKNIIKPIGYFGPPMGWRGAVSNFCSGVKKSADLVENQIGDQTKGVNLTENQTRGQKNVPIGRKPNRVVKK